MLQRLQAAHQVAGLVERLGHAVAAGLPDRLLRRPQLLLQVADVAADLVLERLGGLRRAAADQALRVADLLLELVVPDAVRGFRQTAGGVALLAPELGRRGVDLPLQVRDLGLHGVLALHQPLQFLHPLLVVRHRLQAVDPGGNLALLVGQPVGAAQRLLDVALQAPGLLVRQPVLHVAQPVERGARLGEAQVVGVGRRAAHRVRRLLQPARGVHHLRRAHLAREALQPARGLLRLLGQRALPGAAALGALLPARPPALPLGLALLAAGQLAQALHQLVDGIVRRLLLAALHRLVLVLQLVELQLEQVREVLRRLVAAGAATAAAHAHRHHDLFVRLLRTLEELQRTLLGRQRPVGILALQLGLGLQHGFGGLRQQLGDGAEFRIGRHDAAVHAAQQRLDLLAQAALGEGQEDEVLAVLLVAVVLPVADDVERAGHDLALRLGQRPRIGVRAAAGPAHGAALRLRHAKVPAERADLDEVQVALDVAVRLGEVAVGGAGVVRDEVARLQAELLHEEGVSRRHLLQPAGAAVEELHRLLGAAVGRVDEVQRQQAEVVVGARLDEHLLDGAGGRVAPRRDEHHRRGLVGQHVDGVLRRRGHELAVGRLQLDAVEALLLDHEARRQAAVGLHGQRTAVVLVQHQLARLGGQRGERPQAHLRALQHGDVAAALHELRIEPRVLGKDVLQLQPVDVRQVDDVERVARRLHPGRLDEVVRAGLQVEQQHLEVFGLVHRHEREPLELAAVSGAHEQVHGLRVEADEPRGDGLVGAAGHGGVARGHVDAVRAGRLDVAGRQQERADPVPQVVGTEQQQQDGAGGRGRQQAGRAGELLLLDVAPHVGVAHLLDGRFDEAAHDLRRVVEPGGALALLGLLHGAQQRGLQRRLMLLQVERHALVRDAPRHRPDEQPPAGGNQHQVGHDAERDDGGRTEPVQLQPERRGEEGPQRRGDQDREAAHGHAQAPAVPDVPDNAEHLVATAGELRFVGRHPPGPFMPARVSPSRAPAWTTGSIQQFPRPAGRRQRPGDTTRSPAAAPGPPG